MEDVIYNYIIKQLSEVPMILNRKLSYKNIKFNSKFFFVFHFYHLFFILSQKKRKIKYLLLFIVIYGRILKEYVLEVFMKLIQESLKNLRVILSRLQDNIVVKSYPVENITYKPILQQMEH